MSDNTLKTIILMLAYDIGRIVGWLVNTRG